VGVFAPLDEREPPGELPDSAPEPPEATTEPVDADAPPAGELALDGCELPPMVPVQAASSASIAAKLSLGKWVFMRAAH
jgi:hypothetical protein